MRPKIGDEAQGKWRSILPQVGVSRDFLTGKHGPCPICPEPGKDRFRFTDRGGRGEWICSKCGAGDGVSLVMKINGWEFREAARAIGKLVGSASVIQIRTGRAPDDVRKEMNTIWRSGRPLDEVQATSMWWQYRTGVLPLSKDLRGVNSLYCQGAGHHPAMIALVRDLEGKPINMHRTYLDDLGHKADIPEPRRVMDIAMPKGCAVRLADHAEILGIAEGLETSVCCQQMFEMPVWAALNARNMSEWTPPEGVQKVVIFGDNDRSYTGQWASYNLAMKLTVKKIEVEVRIAPTDGMDWNDVYLSKRMAA